MEKPQGGKYKIYFVNKMHIFLKLTRNIHQERPHSEP